MVPVILMKHKVRVDDVMAQCGVTGYMSTQ